MITFKEASTLVRKYNENHGSDGRFSSDGGKEDETSKHATDKANGSSTVKDHMKAANAHNRAVSAYTRIQNKAEPNSNKRIYATNRMVSHVRMMSGHVQAAAAMTAGARWAQVHSDGSLSLGKRNVRS